MAGRRRRRAPPRLRTWGPDRTLPREEAVPWRAGGRAGVSCVTADLKVAGTTGQRAEGRSPGNGQIRCVSVWAASPQPPLLPHAETHSRRVTGLRARTRKPAAEGAPTRLRGLGGGFLAQDPQRESGAIGSEDPGPLLSRDTTREGAGHRRGRDTHDTGAQHGAGARSCAEPPRPPGGRDAPTGRGANRPRDEPSEGRPQDAGTPVRSGPLPPDSGLVACPQSSAPGVPRQHAGGCKMRQKVEDHEQQTFRWNSFSKKWRKVVPRLRGHSCSGSQETGVSSPSQVAGPPS